MIIYLLDCSEGVLAKALFRASSLSFTGYLFFSDPTHASLRRFVSDSWKAPETSDCASSNVFSRAGSFFTTRINENPPSRGTYTSESFSFHIHACLVISFVETG